MFTQEMNYFASEKSSFVIFSHISTLPAPNWSLARNFFATMFFKALQPALVIVKYLGIF